MDPSESSPDSNADDTAGVGEVGIARAIDDANAVVYAWGDFRQLHQGYLAHARRWDQREPDPLGQVMMRQALSGAALYLSIRPRHEFIAWTLNLADPQVNIFVAGDSARHFVTGRHFTEDVRPTEISRLYVRSQRPPGEPLQTVIDVQGLDILLMFEDYARRSDQRPARYFENDESGIATMILGLPGVDEKWLESLDRGAVEERLENDPPRMIETVPYRFACGCTPERVAQVIRQVYEGEFEDLFQGDETVSVECPRCGHRWDLTPADIENSSVEDRDR